VWGINSEDCPVDLRCNELWVINVDALHRQIRGVSTDIARTGDYLAEMLLTSESEWRDLYDCLIPLIQMDVAQLKRREGTYTVKVPAKKKKVKRDDNEQETEIRLVDGVDGTATEKMEQIGAAVARESEFYAFFEHVRSRLPGAAREEAGESKPRPQSQDRHRRRKWTPSERMGRRFVNLVKKYIRSLTNVEYMQALPVPYTLAYYVVFQRIAWLLFQHNVIDSDSLGQLVTGINSSFFGAPDEASPALCPRLSRHTQRVWRDDWRTTEVPLYALTSVILTERPVFEPPMREPRDDQLAARMHEIHEQNLRVLCGIASMMDISWLSSDIETLSRQVGEVYDWNGDELAFQLMDHIEHSFSSIEAILDDWSRGVTIALGKIDDPHLIRRLHQARVDYGLARYDILAYLQDIEAQTKLCSDLIFWMRQADDADATREWSKILVSLLQAQGAIDQVAQALFQEGQRLFGDGYHNESANRLRQSLVLAEQLGEEGLSEKCKQYLEYTEFFLK